MSVVKSSLRRSTCSINSATSINSSSFSNSSTQRKLVKKDFSKFYVELCNMQHSHPLHMVKQNLNEGSLEITGDRVKFDEWYPIVTGLQSDETLRRICIKLRHRVNTPVLEADTDLKARNVTTHPALVTKFVLYWLIDAIKMCLIRSPSLTTLELISLPLNGEFLALLAEGILEAKCLQHLNLSKCGIRDEGVEVICMAIRNVSTIISLDLSHCQLTHLGAMILAKLISVQKLRRYGEAWTQTLRYRDPDVETMKGLRRLTLNENPDIGDGGLQYLVDEVREDLWLRALDVQNTGLTEAGALALIQLVRDNPHLVVVDARENPAVPTSCLTQIMAGLQINNHDMSHSEYNWINLSKSDDSLRNKTEKKSGRTSMKPWTSPHYRKPSTSTIYSRSQTSLNMNNEPTLRAQTDSYRKENESLRGQLKILNDILAREARTKMDLKQEILLMKQELKKSKMGQMEIEEEMPFRHGISKETLNVLGATLSKLVEMYPHCGKEFYGSSDIPDLLRTIMSVIDQCVEELGAVASKPIVFKTQLNEQTIIEDVEPSETMEKVNAQKMFLNMLKENKKHRREMEIKKYHSSWGELLSPSSGEESS